MDTWRQTFLTETINAFRQYEEWSHHALAQLEDDQAFFLTPGPRSHSIAITVKHVAGNLRSRWKNFLTEDGEKSDRQRDLEFQILPSDTRASLMEAWKQAWGILYAELHALQPNDLERTVTIRTEPLSVIKALQRSLAHTAYHAGQIQYLCRLFKAGDWKWISIAPGQSQQYNQQMAR